MLKFVPNEEKYFSFIRNLRNNPQVKTGFIDQAHINEKQHFIFMQKYGKLYYICLSNGAPIGFIGQIEDDIRIATHPDHQGKGIAKFMVNELMKAHPNCVAKVKIENTASLKLFQSCGFKKKYFILEKKNDS